MGKLKYFDSFNQADFKTKISCVYQDEKQNQILITINGDMEAQHARNFSTAMSDLFTGENNLETVFLDLEKITYISSSCISSFLQLIHQAHSRDYELFFINPKPHMQEVIDAMGLGHFVKKIKLQGAKQISFRCTRCQARVSVREPGKIKCPECGAILTVSDKGLVK